MSSAESSPADAENESKVETSATKEKRITNLERLVIDFIEIPYSLSSAVGSRLIPITFEAFKAKRITSCAPCSTSGLN